MKPLCTWLTMLAVIVGLVAPSSARADELPQTSAPAAEPAHVGVVDNLYLNATVGEENPRGEDATPFALFGANWGVPLTQPDNIAIGLQLSGNVKFREDDPELNSTFGVFGRHFGTFPDQQGAFAMLLDYRHTAFHNDLWDLRPILGTTVTDEDAVGLEIVGGLNRRRGQEAIDEFTTFWTRDWNETVASELGVGYQFSDVDEPLLRGRVAFGLNEHSDLGFGGDVNTDGDYAFGVGVSYHFGGSGRHVFVHNIRGSGSGAYTPFPDASFPELLHRTR